MKIELRERDRRALIGLALALAVYLTLDMALLPRYDTLAAAQELVLTKEDQLRKYRRAVLRQGQYRGLTEDARPRIAELEDVLIRAETEALVSAELQSEVERASQDAGIGISERNVVGIRRLDDFFSEATMTLEFQCSPTELVTFLSGLRSSSSLISVRSADIRPDRVVHQMPNDGDLNRTLRVNLTVGALTPNS